MGASQSSSQSSPKKGNAYTMAYNPSVSIDALQKEIESGANVDTKDHMGRTALMKAVFANNQPAVELLISKGADINAKNDEGATPLMYAITYKNKPAVELLISKGADINAKDNNGRTPLIRARKSTPEILKIVSSASELPTEWKGGRRRKTYRRKSKKSKKTRRH